MGMCMRAQLAERPVRAGQASLGASCDLLYLLQSHPPTSLCVLLPGGVPCQYSVLGTMALWLSILTLPDSNEYMLPLHCFCGLSVWSVALLFILSCVPGLPPHLSMASPVLYPWPLLLHHGSFLTTPCSALSSCPLWLFSLPYSRCEPLSPPLVCAMASVLMEQKGRAELEDFGVLSLLTPLAP